VIRTQLSGIGIAGFELEFQAMGSGDFHIAFMCTKDTQTKQAWEVVIGTIVSCISKTFSVRCENIDINEPSNVSLKLMFACLMIVQA
jgi:hypothetical protein